MFGWNHRRSLHKGTMSTERLIYSQSDVLDHAHDEKRVFVKYGSGPSSSQHEPCRKQETEQHPCVSAEMGRSCNDLT